MAGLSLMSSRIFRLQLSEEFEHLYDGRDDVPKVVEFVAPPRSLYILSGSFRYHYTHEVLAENRTSMVDMSDEPVARRMSLMLRDELLST